MVHNATLRIEDEIVLDARQREIAAELVAVIDRRGARRQNLDDDDGSSTMIASSGRRGPQSTVASGSKIAPESILIETPSAKNLLL
jgi:hypothetical protein